MQEPKTDHTTEKSQDELTAVQPSPTKEETALSDTQEAKDSVEDLPLAASNIVEHITELPTLQEEVAPQELQEFTEIVTSKESLCLFFANNVAQVKICMNSTAYAITPSQAPGPPRRGLCSH